MESEFIKKFVEEVRKFKNMHERKEKVKKVFTEIFKTEPDNVYIYNDVANAIKTITDNDKLTELAELAIELFGGAEELSQVELILKVSEKKSIYYDDYHIKGSIEINNTTFKVLDIWNSQLVLISEIPEHGLYAIVVFKA